MSNTQFPELNKAMREMGQNIASEIDRLQTENEARKARERVLVDALMRAQRDINWMLNSRKFLNGFVFDYIEKALASVKGSAA